MRIPKLKSSVVILYIVFEVCSRSMGQDLLTLKQAFARVEARENVRFFYLQEWIDDITVTGDQAALPLRDFLGVAIKQNKLNFAIYQEKYVVLLGKESGTTARPNDSTPEETVFRADGNTYTIHGFVKEANSGEKLTGATVYVEEEKNGVTVNASGYYSMRLTSGIYTLRASAVGKSPDTRKVFLAKDQPVDFNLFDHVTQLRDVEISAEAYDRNVSSVQMSLVTLSLRELKTMPAFFGEPDVIKSITLLPGVKTVGDGAAGFNVRGGATDQNLVLLEDVPVFNTAHLFGFFSVFNSDAISTVDLFKGGMPAQYGGRTSSVLSVKLKDGNRKKFEARGSVGVISSKFLLEGPIAREKTSFMAGVRYAYPDWILHRVPDLNIRKSSGRFHDVTAKINHRFNDKHNLTLTGYESGDAFKLAADTLYDWTTQNLSLKWNAVISNRVFMEASAFTSKYTYGIEGQLKPELFRANYGINTTGGRLDVSYSSNLQHNPAAGVSINRYEFDMGKLSAAESSSINPVRLDDEKAVELDFYLSDEYKLSRTVTVYGGLRVSSYFNLGQRKVFSYQPGTPKSSATILDTAYFEKGNVTPQYHGWEPRLSLKWMLDEQSSLKASYNRNFQYLQLISNTTAISPLDIWKSSNEHIKPQVAQQFALGYFKNLGANSVETSVEIYYKETENMLEYKDGADLFLNPLIESFVLPALGKAYGAELYVKKNTGKLTGWISYTWSRSLRRVKRTPEGETINRGSFYPSNYDKPHDLALVLHYQVDQRLNFSANFSYNTGRPITYPNEVYLVDGYTFVQFSDRNQGRIQDYHRLDLSINLSESLRTTKKVKGSWTFSLFNVYGRKNPYSVFFKPEFRGAQPQAYRLSVLGSVFPSITYNFKVN